MEDNPIRFDIDGRYTVTISRKQHVEIKPKYKLQFGVAVLYFRMVFTSNPWYNVCPLHKREDSTRIPLFQKLNMFHVMDFREIPDLLLEELIRATFRYFHLDQVFVLTIEKISRHPKAVIGERMLIQKLKTTKWFYRLFIRKK